MTDTTKKESPWAVVLPLAEKILELVDDNAPKGELNISPGFHSHMLRMFVRAHRLYEGVIVLLKAELPEESMFLARSLFEDSLCLQQLAAEPKNRDALILCSVNSSIDEYKSLMNAGITTGLDTDITTALAELNKQQRDVQKAMRVHHVTKLKEFLSPLAGARKFSREDDYWLYKYSHQTVHGSDAAWIYARIQFAQHTGFHAHTPHPVLRSICAHFSARSMSNAYSAASSIFGWTLPPEVGELVNQIDKLIEAHNTSS
jgi:Family of unknown function (DUF5677)